MDYDKKPNNIMVSVLMTSYNHERYVKKALEGVINQNTDFPIEIIIHDDASTDHSQEFIKDFISLHPEINIYPIYQKENQYSKKTGILNTFIYPLVHGKYVICCECDDYWIDKNKLQKQVDFLESHPEYIAIGHNCIFVDENNKPYKNKPYSCYGPYIEHEFKIEELAFGAYPGQTATLMYRFKEYKSSIDAHINITKRIRANGDKKRNLELLLLGRVYYFSEKMSAYRIVLKSGDSWSAKYHSKNRLYESFIDSLDCRKYAKEVFNRSFHNEFQSFYLMAKAIIKRFKSPTKENKQILHQIISEYSNIPLFMLAFIYLGIVSIPRYIKHKSYNHKVTLNEQ